jgi:hypothetical protein
MTGHFTSYENRTDHELATLRPAGLLWAGLLWQAPARTRTPKREQGTRSCHE